MFKPAQQRLKGFNVVEVHDAAELDERSRISHRLPQPNDAHTYSLRDPSLRRSNTQLLFTRHATRQTGDLQLSHVADRFGTVIGISGPGIEYHCFTMLHAGGMALSVPGRKDETQAKVGAGAIHRGRAGTHAVTADGTVRTNLWIATPRLEAALAASLSDSLRTPLAFEPGLDWMLESGPALRRLVLHLAEEFDQSEGIASNPPALAAFTDLFIHTALRGLAHNHSAQLARGNKAPAPRQLRRAEDYMHAHAADPLRMEQVAAVAGCSIRALELAFRRFRETTPYAALTNVRLGHARDELACNEVPIADVARHWGFTNAGRFASVYRRRFGETPSATRRRHATE